MSNYLIGKNIREILKWGQYISMVIIPLIIIYIIVTADGRREKVILRQSYDGMIAEKYVDSSNHMSSFIILRKEKRKKIPIYHNTTFFLLEVGDSVIKQQNSYDIKVIRKDSIFFLNNKTGFGKYEP